MDTNDNIIIGPAQFEYEVLDNDVAGEWDLTLDSEEEFAAFREIFAPISAELESVTFGDITGKITAEFEFSELNLVIELNEEEETTVCENGVTETESGNKVIEMEAEYEAEEGELVMAGSHFLIGEDGEVEDELDLRLSPRTN